MIHFGLIGRKLGHSFSQKFFTAKFAADQVDADYALIEMESIEDVGDIIAKHNLSGFNVTIPYKESIIPYLDELSPEAEAVGAVNCVVVKNGKKIGYNTDIVGVDASLEWLEMATATGILILGTGGASKAVCAALQDMGLTVRIVSRTPQEGQLGYDALTAQVMAEHTVVVNTTPLGMYPHIDSCAPIPYDMLTHRHLCYDVVYNPAETLFMRQAASRGATVCNGLDMLYGQADAAWEIWNK